MIHYKNMSEVSNDVVVKAFNAGFIDYIIQLTLTEELLTKHFLGIEENNKAYSFVAFDDAEPIGVIMGGLDENYEGYKTLRCGALSVKPEYRKQGVAQVLFDLHKELAIHLGCERLYLEVIQGNVKAINFYFKNGYKILSDIIYFELNQLDQLKSIDTSSFEIKEVSLDEVEKIHHIYVKHHLNFQGRFGYLKKIPVLKSFGLFKEGNLVSVISVVPSGKVFYLYTKEEERNQGYAKALLSFYINTYTLNKLMISFPYVDSLKNFLMKNGFTKSFVQQYDMYINL